VSSSHLEASYITTQIETLNRKTAEDLWRLKGPGSESGLVFPMNGNSLRSSEQEARFLFAYHALAVKEIAFSLETPTKTKHGTGRNCARLDLSLYEVTSPRKLANIEFKCAPFNPKGLQHDLQKLLSEDEGGVHGAWFGVIPNSKRVDKTLRRLFENMRILLSEAMKRTDGNVPPLVFAICRLDGFLYQASSRGGKLSAGEFFRGYGSDPWEVIPAESRGDRGGSRE